MTQSPILPPLGYGPVLIQLRGGEGVWPSPTQPSPNLLCMVFGNLAGSLQREFWGTVMGQVSSLPPMQQLAKPPYAGWGCGRAGSWQGCWWPWQGGASGQPQHGLQVPLFSAAAAVARASRFRAAAAGTLTPHEGQARARTRAIPSAWPLGPAHAGPG